ncbi:MAG TPA: glycoside hydrolase, partial [Planctomycetaceae bacterium]|nr:glycoside hydrolase [Planctomycetaceae bacterium]
AKNVTGRISASRPAVVDLVYSLGDDLQTWDEFHPALYRLTVHLRAVSPEGRIKWHDQRVVTFGMREISTRGTQFVLNGRPIFLRGTLECCIFPKTGYPPMDRKAWRRVLGIIRQHGLNHVRFHSWCPPEAAFQAADELGVFFHVECASWANQGAAVGRGRPLDRWLYREADRILKAYGNHPSFLLMAYGNEPAGPGRGADYLGPWVEHYQAKDQRRLYTSAAGWPIIEQSQYHLTPHPRIQHWGAGLKSRINAKPPETLTDYRDFARRHSVPVVSHEIGQWCVYPNFDEIAKYTGVLQAKNFEIFRDFLQANHMGDQARDFLMASGKLQVLCYKEEIESALRTPGFGGFQLLQLHDFPGQGTALVGILDPFFDSKPYVTPDQFRRFCGPIVPLARLPRRVFTEDERLEAAIELYQFGARDLKQAAVRWRLVTATGDVLHQGEFPARDYPAGGLQCESPRRQPQA